MKYCKNYCEEKKISTSKLNEAQRTLYYIAENMKMNKSINEEGYKHFQMAIQALEQESILDKIKADILEEKECAYADFERYKVEYLGQDWEDAFDSLPQDDFRYGMERCIEIIDKYKAEKE